MDQRNFTINEQIRQTSMSVNRKVNLIFYTIEIDHHDHHHDVSHCHIHDHHDYVCRSFNDSLS